MAEKPDVVIDTKPSEEVKVPTPTPDDPQLKKMLDGIVARLGVLEGDFFKSNESVGKNRADLEKFRDFLLDNKTLSFDDFAKKAADSRIIDEMKSPKLDLAVAMGGFFPLSGIWDLFKRKGSDNGKTKSEGK